MTVLAAAPPGAHAVPLAASLPAVALPRATALTDLLLGAGDTRAEPLEGGAAAALRGHLERRLAAAARRATGGHCVRIGTYDLATVLDRARPGPDGERSCGPPPVPERSPFRWTAHRARRTAGLAALRAVLEGRAGSPADAARLVVAAPETHIAGATPPPGSCAEWLATMPTPARAMVEAEAATWATQLWTALDWARLGPGVRVGTPDRWWSGAASRRVAVRGRADVRVAGDPSSTRRSGDVGSARTSDTTDGTGGTGDHGAHLLVLPGHPTLGTRRALALSALVDLCARGPGALPRRVVGWWPECGKAWAVPVDEAALCATADAVVRAAEDALATGGGRR